MLSTVITKLIWSCIKMKIMVWYLICFKLFFKFIINILRSFHFWANLNRSCTHKFTQSAGCNLDCLGVMHNLSPHYLMSVYDKQYYKKYENKIHCGEYYIFVFIKNEFWFLRNVCHCCHHHHRYQNSKPIVIKKKILILQAMYICT